MRFPWDMVINRTETRRCELILDLSGELGEVGTSDWVCLHFKVPQGGHLLDISEGGKLEGTELSAFPGASKRSLFSPLQ